MQSYSGVYYDNCPLLLFIEDKATNISYSTIVSPTVSRESLEYRAKSLSPTLPKKEPYPRLPIRWVCGSVHFSTRVGSAWVIFVPSSNVERSGLSHPISHLRGLLSPEPRLPPPSCCYLCVAAFSKVFPELAVMTSTVGPDTSSPNTPSATSTSSPTMKVTVAKQGVFFSALVVHGLRYILRVYRKLRKTAQTLR